MSSARGKKNIAELKLTLLKWNSSLEVFFLDVYLYEVLTPLLFPHCNSMLGMQGNFVYSPLEIAYVQHGVYHFLIQLTVIFNTPLQFLVLWDGGEGCSNAATTVSGLYYWPKWHRSQVHSSLNCTDLVCTYSLY